MLLVESVFDYKQFQCMFQHMSNINQEKFISGIKCQNTSSNLIIPLHQRRTYWTKDSHVTPTHFKVIQLHSYALPRSAKYLITFQSRTMSAWCLITKHFSRGEAFSLWLHDNIWEWLSQHSSHSQTSNSLYLVAGSTRNGTKDFLEKDDLGDTRCLLITSILSL